MNLYATLQEMKAPGALQITAIGLDPRLLTMIEDVSRMVDDLVGRHFYELAATRVFDGDGGSSLLLDDLISIDTSGLKTDDNKDRTFESTWALTDYLLRPNNADPANRGNPRSRPYWEIVVDPSGTKAEFTFGMRTIEVAGKWGYWEHLKRAVETADTIADGTTTTINVSAARTDIVVGHTIKIDDEQLYVNGSRGDELTVDRGVNGTTGASHSNAAAIDIYEYPATIREATMIQTSRLWRRRESAFANAVGFPDGTTQIFSGLDKDVQNLIKPYQRFAF